MSLETIYNHIRVDDAVATAGQPSPDQLRAAASEGFTAVINLATEAWRWPQDEAELVRSLGMDYFHIPVDWENPKASDFAAFEQTMSQLPPGRTLIHCAANYRVTAFYALYALKHRGWSADQAEQFRAQIWQGSDYPIWEQFMTRMKAQ